ncbi:sigma factor [Nocardia sp. NPDC052278]|uniref:sigma factor n=1 Tax=Nocardia sp. NPDC052278 TaxID=3364328 RepID=UPI0037CA67F7
MAAGTVEMFERHRARLLGLAYRMLGSAADAEDIVQDAFPRLIEPMACHGIAAVEKQSWTRL